MGAGTHILYNQLGPINTTNTAAALKVPSSYTMPWHAMHLSHVSRLLKWES